MPLPIWLRAVDLSPWFRNSMTQEDRERVSDLRGLGVHVSGFASSAHGPFTCRLVYSEDQHATGAGTSAHEALERAVTNLGEVAA